MCAFYSIHPEVAGGLGERTEMDTTRSPPEVHTLHYEFDGWLGDDLLSSHPCYIVSEQLKRVLESSKLTGFRLDDVCTSKSDQFKELQSTKELPTFYWLKVEGEPGSDDFGISDKYELIVSDAALDLMNDNTLEQAMIEEYEPEEET
ncbi:hypothetical protein [Halovivax cerinus]|uniref:Uncharacterized protein n=1 Tax=Halovivax cerinus TaxID=1487865 RepID=A0ABD5NMT3_9EURY|nr:hypothetical protein [Halovivax cerinus]